MCAPPLVVDDQDRRVLERLSRSVSESLRVVGQARALLSAADGVADEETARRVGVAPNTVRAWRRGFAAGGLGWLGAVAPGRGPERSLTVEQEAAIVADTLHVEPPDGAECWSTRALGARHGVGKDIVARVWRERGLRPWRADVFKLSTAPDFEAELHDVIGLYLKQTLNAPRCSASTRRPRSRPWTGPSRRCRWSRAGAAPRLMTTSATAPSTCSPRSTSPAAKCCIRPANAAPAKTCWRSSNGSTCTPRAISKCT